MYTCRDNIPTLSSPYNVFFIPSAVYCAMHGGTVTYYRDREINSRKFTHNIPDIYCLLGVNKRYELRDMKSILIAPKNLRHYNRLPEHLMSLLVYLFTVGEYIHLYTSTLFEIIVKQETFICIVIIAC